MVWPDSQPADRNGRTTDGKPDSRRLRRSCSRIFPCSPSLSNSNGFTLIELLVVIAVIAVLLAVLVPVMRVARERAQRIVCQNNLRQLTVAWIAYADAHDGRLVGGASFGEGSRGQFSGRWRLESWVGWAFQYPESREALLKDPDKGALWPYLKDVDVYRCPRGRSGHAVTYTPVVAANNPGVNVEGTYVADSAKRDVTEVGVRIKSTVLKLTRLTDIVSPGPASRAVFIDMGETPSSDDYYAYFLYPQWPWSSPPPLRHGEGTTLSMADGHVEHWRWQGRETVDLPRKLNVLKDDTVTEQLAGSNDYIPQTEDGLYDLTRLQRAIWGRLGYSTEETP